MEQSLRAAIENRDTEMCELLLEAGAEANDKEVREALYYAVNKELTDIVKMIIEKAPNSLAPNFDVNDYDYYSPLIRAIEKGNVEIFKLLVEAGANLDTPNGSPDYDGDTPLIYAIRQGELQMCKLLVDAGADLDKQNNDGFTALMLANQKGHEDVCDILLTAGAKPLKEAYAEMIKKLFLDTLDAIMRIWVEKIDDIEKSKPYGGDIWPRQHQQPRCVLRLMDLHSNSQKGWLDVVQALAEAVPLEHPRGPITTALLIKLTTKWDIAHYDMYGIDVFQELLRMASSFEANDRRHGNISITICCLAVYFSQIQRYTPETFEKFLGILTSEMLAYLFGNLNAGAVPEAATFSLLALEFLAHNIYAEYNLLYGKELGEKQNPNAEIVKKRFSEFSPIALDHPLLRLEKLVDSQNFAEKQAGFLAKWYLDNLWTIDNQDARTPNIIDNTNINVTLIPIDKSKHSKVVHLKVGSNGLELFGNGLWFETAMSTVQVDEGSWYYEVTLVTSGLMQIGWATKQSKFMQNYPEWAEYAVGDDLFSLAYDGCRQVVWHDREQPSDGGEPLGWEFGEGIIKSWKPGDVVGSFIHLKEGAGEIVFSLNGVNIRSEPYNLWQVFFQRSYNDDPGFFAAISLMSFQQCKVNFGGEPFKHPPEGRAFKPLNEATMKSI